MMQHATPRAEYAPLPPHPDAGAAYAAPRRHRTSRWACCACLLLATGLLVYVMQSSTVDPETIGLEITGAMVKVGMIRMNASLIQCQISHKNLPDTEYFEALGDTLAQWTAPACQGFFECRSELLLTHRTCTAEDTLSESMRPQPHETRLLVSERYRTVYVVNPTTVDYLVQHIMITQLQAREQSSLQISQYMIDWYFVFTFVDEPHARFFYAAEASLRAEWDANASCADRVRQMEPLTRLQPSRAHTVHSQAYQLSADAGVSNIMLRLNWAHHASTFRTSIVSLIRHIQHWNRECIPEIDFRELNFQLITRHQEAQARAQTLRACSSVDFNALLAATYAQDSVCFA